MKLLSWDVKQILRNVALTVVGTLLLSLATSLFILPYQLVVGGMSGLAIVVNLLLPLGEELWIAIFTVGTYLLGLIFLNKSFALKTLVSTIVYPLGVSLFSYLASPDVLNGFFYLPSSDYAEIGILLAAIFGGVLTGVGCAITFLGGGSTGGTDIVAFVICKFFKKAKSSVVLFLVDGLIIVMGMFACHNIVVTLLGITCAFLTAFAIDKVFLGQDKAFVANIVSSQHQQINRQIIEKLDRTTSVVDIVGGYTGQERKMLLFTFTMREYATLMNIVDHYDPDAFVTIQPAHEINGEGFSRKKT